MSNRSEYVVVANLASTGLGVKVAAALGFKFTTMICKQFADGENFHAFPEDIAGKALIIVASTHTESSHQELMDLIQGGRYYNAASVNVVIPYLGYSTMERAKRKRGYFEIPKGVTRTRQIFRARPDFVAFVDLHSEAVLHAHGGDISTKHIWTGELVVEHLQKMDIGEYVLVSPDYGFSKQVAKLASLLNCSHTAADKDRYDTDKTIVSQVSSVVKGKTAVICDDMIRTGGSIIQTAERCMDAGATGIAVLASHLVMAGGARQRFLDNSITKVIGSDSYPGRVSDDLLEVYSLAPLLAKILKGHLVIR
ncbi:MAG: ribose-phosphate pyrophosphokinase [Desulfocapsa sp.]|uniref:ribose-phosphate diphosphokinase n=1 Tax=Desulfotalea psychrophila TaxID=84980 RepID=A0ABS3ATN2_9BACT|nr:ribose-phosphate pyrophosphokinase [Desulfocapsa sp.]MBN4068317.1 ribose-phosphate pyrophosphokinase [Desulfotalea psychrophila]